MENFDTAAILGRAIRNIDGFLNLDISGKVTFTCDYCEGTGQVQDLQLRNVGPDPIGPETFKMVDCPKCKASGKELTVISLAVTKQPGEKTSPSKK